MRSNVSRCVFLTLAAAASGSAVSAGEIDVVANVATSQTWTADNSYRLTDQIYVLPGATLTIEAGTLITSPLGGSLAVTRGAQIFVEGTADAPVIMTSLADVATWTGGDPKTGSWRVAAGEWGNLTVMGQAFVSEDVSGSPGPNSPTCSPSNVAAMEGLVPDFFGDPKTLYGGGDDDDDSGSIRFLSLRYGGKVVALANELNGLSLGGVGRGTDIEHVEVMNNVDDGIEVFGGTVNLKYVSVWNVGDDSIDVDQGWRGKAQFILIVQGYSLDAPQGSGVGDNCFETDGAESSDWQPVTTATVYNATVIGQPMSGDHATAWRDNARVQYRNCVFMDIGDDLVRFDNVDLDGGMGYGHNGTLSWSETWSTSWTATSTVNPCANPSLVYTAQHTGNLAQIADSVFYNVADTTEAASVGVFGAANDNVTSASLPIRSIDRAAPILVNGLHMQEPALRLDPRPANDALTSVGSAPNDGFYTPAAYRGAFAPGENWAAGWTAASAYGLLVEAEPKTDWFKETLPLTYIGPERPPYSEAQGRQQFSVAVTSDGGEEALEFDPTGFPLVRDPCTGSIFHAYAPPEVENPSPAQILTVFIPERQPDPSDRFPVLLYSPASVFSQALYPPDCTGSSGGSCAGEHRVGFLRRALEAGWAVVTVGSVGHNTWPTCDQPAECNYPDLGLGEPPTCGAHPSGCWDQNLFYPEGTAPWDDFNYFFGEKDFTWARQYIAHKADELYLDNDRVVACGTSTGGHYASYLALGPDRSWTSSASPECEIGGPDHQVEQDTRVAGLVTFEPVVWLRAAASVPSSPFAIGLSGAHWPSCESVGFECWRAGLYGSGTIEDTPIDFLTEGSASSWVRAYGPTIPVFIASGDGLTSGFGRDGDAFPGDYDRDMAGDPTLSFPDSPPLRLHDAWHALVLRQDLDLVDSAYHAQHSRLYLRGDTNWEFIPDALTNLGSGDPDGPEDVPLVDGEYGCNCDGSQPGSCGDTVPPLCTSILNEELASTIVDWLEVEFCDVTASVATRNAGTNPESYASERPVLGATITASVDVSLTGHDKALIIGYASPATFTLAGGQTLLCFSFAGEGELLNTGFFDGPTASIPIALPADPSLVGDVVCTQAIHAFGSSPFALSNAQDWVLGCE